MLKYRIPQIVTLTQNRNQILRKNKEQVPLAKESLLSCKSPPNGVYRIFLITSRER